MSEPEPRPARDTGRLAAGVMIIVFGVLLLLDRAGMIEWANRTGWWPLLAIAFGVIRMATDSGGIRSGVFFVLVGGWGLLNEFGVLHYDESWPLLLVIGGGSIVLGSLSQPSAPLIAAPAVGVSDGSNDTWRARRRARRLSRGGVPFVLLWILIWTGIMVSVQGGRRQRDDRTDSNDVIQRSAVLGQSQTVSYATDLRRGHLLAVMGECDIDLTHAVVAPGQEADVNVLALMGSIKLKVPHGWVVDIRTVPAIGTVKDYRIGRMAQDAADAPPDAAGQASHIVLRGFVMMGDVSIH